MKDLLSDVSKFKEITVEAGMEIYLTTTWRKTN